MKPSKIETLDMIYLLTAIGLPPGGSSRVYIYTQTINRTAQNKQYIEQHKNLRRVRALPRLGEFYPIFVKLHTHTHTHKQTNKQTHKYIYMGRF